MATVKVTVGGREFRRDVGSRLVIGRDMDCDVQVDDPKISRLHCLIERKGEDYVAVDLDSHNGTKISGWPLTRHRACHWPPVRPSSRAGPTPFAARLRWGRGEGCGTG